MAKQLLGKEVTAALNEKIIGQVAQLKEKGVSPKLGIIRVGERPDDISYETGATKRCDTLGVEVEKILLPEDVSKEELLEVIDKVNKDDSIHGVLMFRPLPAHLKAVQSEIENALDPAKDVDCMTHLSLAGVFEGKPLGFPPCTPQACMEILDYYGIDCKGKNAVVIGRSLVVGKPAAMMLMGKNATVTVCHTKTVDVPAIAREADILISCAGVLNSLTKEYVRPGQIVIDVSINWDPEKINKQAACALYMGIAHDTGVFQYSCTSPDTMRVAAMLMEKGVPHTYILEETYYKKTYRQNQVMGKALLESMRLMDGKIIISVMRKREMDFFGVTTTDLDGIVSQLKLTEGVEVAIFLYEVGNMEFKVSLRSKEQVDVSKVASYFGGGGHVRAAGVTMKGTFHDIINNLTLHIERQMLHQEE